MDEAQQVLAGVPEAHAPARAAFEVGSGAAHVEGDHALVLVPGVNHPVQRFLRGADLEIGEQSLPIAAQGLEGGFTLLPGPVAFHQRVGPRLVDHAGGGELLLLRVFDVPQAQEKTLLRSRGQLHVELHGAHRGPALGQGARTGPLPHRLRRSGRAIGAHERVPGGIEALEGAVGPEDRVVVPALPVLGFVVDGIGLHFHFSCGEVPLEVGAVVHCVPEAELHEGEELQGLPLPGAVFHGQLHQQAPLPPGDKEPLDCQDAVFFAFNLRIAQAVAAAVSIQLRLHGLPARVPDKVPVLDIDVEALLVRGTVVVTVAGDPAQARVFIEAIPPRSVGQQGEEILAAQVVDPGKGGPGRGHDILPPGSVKASKLHRAFPPIWMISSLFSIVAKTIKSSV